jgi:hypothetical protein
MRSLLVRSEALWSRVHVAWDSIRRCSLGDGILAGTTATCHEVCIQRTLGDEVLWEGGQPRMS